MEVGGRRCDVRGPRSEIRGPVVGRRSSVLGFFEQFAGGSYGLFDLPQSGTTVEAKRIQRTNLGECGDLVTAQAAAADQLIERLEPIADCRLRIAD